MELLSGYPYDRDLEMKARYVTQTLQLQSNGNPLRRYCVKGIMPGTDTVVISESMMM